MTSSATAISALELPPACQQREDQQGAAGPAQGMASTRHAAFVPPSRLTPLSAPRRQPTCERRPRRAPVLRAAATDDLYSTLGVERGADTAAVKRAYRRAALQNHPDVSKKPDAKDRFMRIQDAYAVLSNPVKRARYDREVARGTAGGFGAGQAGGMGDGGFDAAEYARSWRERNPMPSDINDDLGSIFSDLFSGVASAVGSGASTGSGVVEDFVDFLEKKVEGFGVDEKGYASDDASDDGLEDILASSDTDVLETEIEDGEFLLEQLRARSSKLGKKAEGLEERAARWGVRSKTTEANRDYMARDAARDSQRELKEEAKRLRQRARKVDSHIQRQMQRQEKIKARLSEVRRNSTTANTSASRQSRQTASPGAASGTAPDFAVDEELERMKREMGL